MLVSRLINVTVRTKFVFLFTSEDRYVVESSVHPWKPETLVEFHLPALLLSAANSALIFFLIR